jgi:hypothetical protein
MVFLMLLRERKCPRKQLSAIRALRLIDLYSLPAYWAAEATIVVNDTVRINKPYGVSDIQAVASNSGSLQQVKKILEAYYAKQKVK